MRISNIGYIILKQSYLFLNENTKTKESQIIMLILQNLMCRMFSNILAFVTLFQNKCL